MRRSSGILAAGALALAASPALAHAGHVGAFAQAGGGLPATIEVTPQGQQTIGLAVTEVDSRPLDTALTTPGRIEADGLHRYDVTVPVAGRAVAVLASPGQRVARGQVLARIESPDLAKAQYDLLAGLNQADADLATARSQLTLANADRARERRLFAQGIAAGKDAQSADAQARQAAVAVAAATDRRALALGQVRSHLTALGFSERAADRLIRSRKAGNALELVAPGAGVVTALGVSLGQNVNAGDRAFEVVDPSTVWAVADVYEPDLAKVHVGQAMEIATTGAQGHTYRAKVDSVGSVIDPQRRTAEVRATLPSDGDRLEPGAFATIRLLTGKTAPVLAIPVSAVFDDSGLKAVWVQNGDAEFDLEHVQLGATSGQWAEVTSGVEEGDQVVSTGAYQLTAEALKEAHGAVAQAAPGEGGGADDDDDGPKKPAAGAKGAGGSIPNAGWLAGLAGAALVGGIGLFFRRYRIVPR